MKKIYFGLHSNILVTYMHSKKCKFWIKLDVRIWHWFVHLIFVYLSVCSRFFLWGWTLVLYIYIYANGWHRLWIFLEFLQNKPPKHDCSTHKANWIDCKSVRIWLQFSFIRVNFIWINNIIKICWCKKTKHLIG